MEQKPRLITVLLVVLMLLGINPLVGVNKPGIQFIEKIEFSPESESPLVPRAFCVTDDELFIIPDYQSGNIKIYEKSGKYLELIKTIGQKGFGQNKLVKPAFCFYNKEESKFGVMDFGLRKVFIYDRIGRVEFILKKAIYCFDLGFNIQISGNRLLISGHKTDKNERHYHLYSVDLKNNEVINLLPSYQKYGFNSHREFEVEIYKDNIGAIGINGWFDIQGDVVFFVWEGDLRIIKINIKSQEITTFGEKTSSYIKPYASKKLLEARQNRNFNVTRSEKEKMSFVRNIFTNPKYVLVIYEGPNPKNFRLQFYTLEGTFKGEVPIPGQPNWKMWYDKNGNFLYSLSNNSDKGVYFILKYKILE